MGVQWVCLRSALLIEVRSLPLCAANCFTELTRNAPPRTMQTASWVGSGSVLTSCSRAVAAATDRVRSFACARTMSPRDTFSGNIASTTSWPRTVRTSTLFAIQRDAMATERAFEPRSKRRLVRSARMEFRFSARLLSTTRHALPAEENRGSHESPGFRRAISPHVRSARESRVCSPSSDVTTTMADMPSGAYLDRCTLRRVRRTMPKRGEYRTLTFVSQAR